VFIEVGTESGISELNESTTISQKTFCLCHTVMESSSNSSMANQNDSNSTSMPLFPSNDVSLDLYNNNNETLLDVIGEYESLDYEDLNFTDFFDDSNTAENNNNNNNNSDYNSEDGADAAPILPPYLESVCPVAAQTLQKEFDWRGRFGHVPFYDTKAITMAHYWPQRYGNPSKIELLWRSSSSSSNNSSNNTNSNDDRVDYVMGIVACCITIFCIFLVWLVTLLIFKYWGPHKVGFWSGRFPELPPKPEVVEEDAVKERQPSGDDSPSEREPNQIKDHADDVEGQREISEIFQMEPEVSEEQVEDNLLSRRTTSLSEIEEPSLLLFPPNETAVPQQQEEAGADSVFRVACTCNDNNTIQLDRSAQCREIAASFVQRIQNPFALFDPSLFQNCNAVWAQEQQIKQQHEEQRQRELQQPEQDNVNNNGVNDQPSRSIKMSQIWHDVHNLFSIRVPPESEGSDGSSSSRRSSLRSSLQKRLSSSLRSMVTSSHRQSSREISIPEESSSEFLRHENQILKNYDDDPCVVDSQALSKSSRRNYSNDADDLEQAPNEKSGFSIFVSSKEKESHDAATKEDERSVAVAIQANDNLQMRRWEEAYRGQRRQLRICQFAVVFSGICIIASAVLMAFAGVDSLLKTMKESIELIRRVDRVAGEGVIMVDDVIRIVGKAANLTGNVQHNSAI
jgi:hypothetical protein